MGGSQPFRYRHNDVAFRLIGITLMRPKFETGFSPQAPELPVTGNHMSDGRPLPVTHGKLHRLRRRRAESLRNEGAAVTILVASYRLESGVNLQI